MKRYLKHSVTISNGCTIITENNTKEPNFESSDLAAVPLGLTTAIYLKRVIVRKLELFHHFNPEQNQSPFNNQVDNIMDTASSANRRLKNLQSHLMPQEATTSLGMEVRPLQITFL